MVIIKQANEKQGSILSTPLLQVELNSTKSKISLEKQKYEKKQYLLADGKHLPVKNA